MANVAMVGVSRPKALASSLAKGRHAYEVAVTPKQRASPLVGSTAVTPIEWRRQRVAEVDGRVPVRRQHQTRSPGSKRVLEDLAAFGDSHSRTDLGRDRICELG